MFCLQSYDYNRRRADQTAKQTVQRLNSSRSVVPVLKYKVLLFCCQNIDYKFLIVTTQVPMQVKYKYMLYCQSRKHKLLCIT